MNQPADLIVLPVRVCESADGENIAVFIASCLASSPSERTRVKHVYTAYLAWCTRVGARAKAAPYLFAQEMRAFGIQTCKSGVIFYTGVVIRPEPLPIEPHILRTQVYDTTDEAGRLRAWTTFNRMRRYRGYEPWDLDRFCAKKYDLKKTSKTAAETRDEVAADKAARINADLVRWVGAALVRKVGARTQASELFSRYSDWADSKGLERLDLGGFIAGMKANGHVIRGGGTQAVAMMLQFAA